MPDIWYDVDAALSEVPVNLLPLMDDTDFKAIEADVNYNAAGLSLIWHFVTTAGAYSQTAVTPTDTGGDYDWVEQGNGLFTIEIPAAAGATINNNTEGFGWFTGVATGVLPWRGPVIGFRAGGLNDALVDSAYSATRGLAGTALPDAAADAAGGLPISDAGALDLDAQLVTKINDILTDTGTTIDDLVDDLETRLGTPSDFGSGASVAKNLVDIEGQTDDIGAAGAGLTAIGPVTLANGAHGGAGASLTLGSGMTSAITGSITGNLSGTVGSVSGNVGGIAGTLNTIDALWAKIQKWLRLALRKDAATATDCATELAEVNADGGSGAGAYANTTDAQEALRDRGDAAWITAIGFAVPGSQMDLVNAPNGTAITAIQNGLATGANQTTILNRLGAWTGTTVNTVLGAFKALLSKVATIPTDIGGTFDPATDSTEAISESIPAAAPAMITAQEVRDAMKLDAGVGAPAAGSVDAHLDTLVGFGAPPAMIGAQAIRDAMKLDAGVGAPAAGSVDAHLDTVVGFGAPPAMITALAVRDAMKLAPSVGAPAADSVDIHLDDILADTSAIVTPPTVTAIADQVWDEALAGHVGVGSTGAKLNSITPPTVTAIADQVWDEAIAGHLGVGSTGATLSGASAPTVGQVADAVWDEVIAGHLGVGSTGAKLNTASAPTAGAVADAVWDEAMADHLAVGSTGRTLASAGGALTPGAIEFTYTVTDSVTGLPIEGVEVWFTTDAPGANIVWAGVTNAFGVARDVLDSLPWLDAGTYYVWRQKAGYAFSNPDVEAVS